MPASKKTSYTIDMCNGPLLRKMLLFALPLVLSTLLQLLFNAADLVVVSRFAGDNAMAAVGANSSLINLLVNLFMGLSVGANVQAARERGAGLREDLHRTIHTAMTLSLLSGVILIFVGVLGATSILKLMQIPEKILDQAALYLRIYFLGMPATMAYNFGAALLRAVGDTRRPLYYLTVAGVVNVVLNLILVIVFHMDVAGVAIATVTSQVISAILVIRCMVRDEGDIRLELKKLRVHPDKLKSIMRVGIPAGLQSILFSLSNVVIQSSVNGFGEVIVAGNAAALNIEGFIYCVVNALHQTTLSFTGQNIGGGKRERIPRILVTAQGCMVAAAVIIALVCGLWGEGLVGIYSKTPEVVEAGLVRLRLLSATYLLCGIMDITVGSLRGMGQSIIPMIVSLVGVCGIRLCWIATVFQIPAYHTIGTIYMSYPISWTLTATAHLICWFVVVGKMKKNALRSN